MTNTAEDRPPAVPPRLRSAPKIRQIYWCDFPQDAQLPEFWKRRPVIVVSYRNKLSGAVTVIPCSTLDQSNNPWAVLLSTSMTIGASSWAICDKPYTVAVSRLFPDRQGIPRLSMPDFDAVLSKLLQWLPTPTPTPTPVPAPAPVTAPTPATAP